MEYLSNTELLIAIFGLVVLTISYFAYKSLAKSKGITENSVIDDAIDNAYIQASEQLKDKIADEIAETKEEIKQKNIKKKAPLVPPSDLVVPMPPVKKAREPKKKNEAIIEETEDESDSGK